MSSRAEDNRTARRDAARHRRRHGQRVSGASLKRLALALAAKGKP